MDKKFTRKDAFQTYRERVFDWLPVSLMLFIVFGCCAALSLLGGLWVLLGLALLVLPAVFAASQFLGTAFTKDETDTRIITHAFGAYFRAPMLGVYRAIFNLFLTIVCSFGAAGVFMVSSYMFALSVDPALYEAADSALNTASLGDYSTAMSLMQNDATLIRISDLTLLVFVYAMAFFFWLFTSKYMQNGVLRNAFAVDNSRFANYFYGHYRAVVKEEWVPLRRPFFLFPLSIMAVSLATSLICYFCGVEIHYCLLFGLLALSLLLSLYLPLGLYLQLGFAFSHQGYVAKAFYLGSKRILSIYEASGRFSKEEMEKMRKDVENLRPKEKDEETEE